MSPRASLMLARGVLLGSALALCACPSKPAEVPDAGHPGAGHLDAGSVPQVTLSLSAYSFPKSGPVDGGWVAVQDGDGGWSVVSGVNGSFQFPVKEPAGRYGVAIQCRSGTLKAQRLQVIWATLAEAPTLEVSCPLSPAPTASGADFYALNWPTGTNHATLLLTNGNTDFITQGQGYELDIYNGVQALGCVAVSANAGRWTAGILRRDEELAFGKSESFDFASAAAFSSVPFHVSTVGVTSDDVTRVLENTLLSGQGSQLAFPVPAFAAAATLDSPPPSALLATDRLLVSSGLINASSAVRGDTRVLSGGMDLTLTPPEYLQEPGLDEDVDRLPFRGFTAHWSSGGPANPGALVILQQDKTVFGVTLNYQYQLLATHGWLGSATSLTLPDLTGLPDFDPNLQLDGSATIAGLLEVYDSDSSPTAQLNFYGNGDPSGLLAGQHLTYAAQNVSAGPP